MTAPRQVLPGTCYLVSRRCTQRQFLLRPGRLVNQAFLYLLALAAQRYGVRVHAFCVLSNHYHLILTDPHARLPAFGQLLDALVARALNTSLGRSESFWAPNSYSAVALATPEDILAKAAYVLANPVAAGLVRTGREWPGLWSSPERIGTTIVARKPGQFFNPKGQLPESVALELAAPPGFASAEDFARALRGALEEREVVEQQGKSFLGAARVLAQRFTSRPALAQTRGGLNPRVAARDKWKRIEVLRRLSDFLRAYREALAAWTRNDPAVVFPAGTYQMRVLHGAPCAAFG
ncbi:MAG: hypothetical protein HZB56_08000 [Deltaproteobacteria bacterium]|nr:hypothetical protein [Deltaproteobacteria bacterium]